jgi:hypothetical protein
MEILAAFDLTKTFESAGRLAGVDAKTVKRYVTLRDEAPIRWPSAAGPG